LNASLAIKKFIYLLVKKKRALLVK